ncbi:MAG: hypothetical protein NTW29_00845 [Bacteroidetes bacterium]|nr:hypothetical protein [Bacteroidota bacterium]
MNKGIFSTMRFHFFQLVPVLLVFLFNTGIAKGQSSTPKHKIAIFSP